MTNLVSRTLFIISTLVVVHFQSIAQKKYVRLHIGDVVPDIHFDLVRNYSGLNKQLTDFEGKYIILDFWDKTCSSCIALMPEMQNLQQEFKDSLQVILVTHNNYEGLSQLFRYSPIVKNVTLPMVLQDSILSQVLFPAESLPHHVWLDKKFKVLAITYGYEATEENISKMVRGEKLNLAFKDRSVNCDAISNGQKTLATFDNGLLLRNLVYYSSPYGLNINSEIQNIHDDNVKIEYSLFTKKIELCNRQKSAVWFKDSVGNELGRLWYNVPLLDLFRCAYLNGQSNKIVIDPKLNSKLKGTDLYEIAHRSDKTSYCYETFFPGIDDLKFLKRLKEDLRKAFQIYGTIELRNLPCLILYRISTAKQLPYSNNDEPEIFENTESENGFIISNTSLGVFCDELSAAFNSGNDPMFIDESGIPRGTLLTMTLHIQRLRDIQALKRELAKYGIGLKQEIRNCKVLVLKKAD